MKQINSLKAQNASFERALEQAEEERIVMQAQVVAWQDHRTAAGATANVLTVGS